MLILLSLLCRGYGGVGLDSGERASKRAILEPPDQFVGRSDFIGPIMKSDEPLNCARHKGIERLPANHRGNARIVPLRYDTTIEVQKTNVSLTYKANNP